MLEGYGLHTLIWDSADERLGDFLVASPADASWALPSSGLTGSQCFYSCSTSLVGCYGTVWASNKTAYTYFRIDTASTPGYITIA